mmetsp:Transcript_19022/g.61243  ORF Transcript_19022/g.61243 Transcript_19022/m.61243 type:complete len:204 (+) Transcript_19022:1301-1912(+)
MGLVVVVPGVGAPLPMREHGFEGHHGLDSRQQARRDELRDANDFARLATRLDVLRLRRPRERRSSRRAQSLRSRLLRRPPRPRLRCPRRTSHRRPPPPFQELRRPAPRRARGTPAHAQRPGRHRTLRRRQFPPRRRPAPLRRTGTPRSRRRDTEKRRTDGNDAAEAAGPPQRRPHDRRLPEGASTTDQQETVVADSRDGDDDG